MTASLIDVGLNRVTARNGVTYAYRRFGPTGSHNGNGVPLVFLQHFRGNIDNWDPALVDPIAAQREVVLFDNTGVGATTGVTPATVEEMTGDALEFIDALDLSSIDLFGYSIGGFVAQLVALARPALVRRLILAGTGPKGAPGMGSWRPDVLDGVVADEIGPEGVLRVFYRPTASSQAAGRAATSRIYKRHDGRDEVPSIASKNAQYEAVRRWGAPNWEAVRNVTLITQPTLILQGDNDIMIPTSASYLLAGLIPNSRIIIYPDASHGSIFQYAEDASARILGFVAR